MKKAATLLTALILGSLAQAQIVSFEAHLNGAEEVPVRATPATGTATATLDTTTNFFTLQYVFSGLLGTQTDAHIHGGARGTNGPVLFHLGLGSPNSFSTFLTDLQESRLLSSLWYVNIHSTVFPGGEIRGQLQPVPEPSTYALFGVAALGVGIAWKRRQAKRTTAVAAAPQS